MVINTDLWSNYRQNMFVLNRLVYLQWKVCGDIYLKITATATQKALFFFPHSEHLREALLPSQRRQHPQQLRLPGSGRGVGRGLLLLRVLLVNVLQHVQVRQEHRRVGQEVQAQGGKRGEFGKTWSQIVALHKETHHQFEDTLANRKQFKQGTSFFQDRLSKETFPNFVEDSIKHSNHTT